MNHINETDKKILDLHREILDDCEFAVDIYLDHSYVCENPENENSQACAGICCPEIVVEVRRKNEKTRKDS